MAFFDLTNPQSDDSQDQPDLSKVMSIFGPGQVDQLIRQALQTCWMMLPSDKKTPDELEATLRHIVERAIQNFREDSVTFRNP